MAIWQGTGAEFSGTGLVVEDVAPLQLRLSDLETSLALERYERQALARELENLGASMAALPARVSGDHEDSGTDPRELRANAAGNDAANDRFADGILERLPDGTPQSLQALEQFVRQQRFDRFVAAGIASGQAQAIMQREEELEMEVLRARYAATQSRATPQEVAKITPLALLRTELGDTEYAKYLEARGRRPSVTVREVLRSSPAEIAGLKPGDEIVASNGRRVFDMNELDALTYQATAGAMVPLQVIRDGQSIEFYVAAGPIGIGAP
jgi:hypothetical protein